uniref:Extended synaptotagmin-1 n=1 Tax=Sphenodon punctatus TaxID=8508 RepID=A0A8D0L3P3_SPHPU
MGRGFHAPSLSPAEIPAAARGARPGVTMEPSQEAEVLDPGPSPGGLSSAEALAALGAFGRRLLWLLPVYLAGRSGLSVGFVLLGLAVYLGWKGARRGKERSLLAAKLLLGDERAAVRATAAGAGLGRELPAWVNFPDVEKAEWLNKILAQAWPFFGQYMEKLLVENIAPSIRASNTHLQTFTFTKIDMGEKPLKIMGVKVHTGANKQQILLDLNVSYAGDVQIDVEVKKFFCKAGVKGMQLHGMLRVILEPLIGDVPIVGALTMFFIRRPTLSINWTGMTNLLDIPGLSSMSDTMIMDSIASFLVLPNRLLVPLVPDLHEAAQLRSPLPRGVVRVHLLAARDLQSKDKYVKGLIEGKSDPYAIVRVGTQVFTSRVINENLNPTWNETYEFVVHEVPGQELEVELFDKDPDQDDFLGSGLEQGVGMWLGGQEGSSAGWETGFFCLFLGRILDPLPHLSPLHQVLQRNKGISSKPEPPSAAILVVYLDRAQELPLAKSGKEPNPIVQLSIQDVTRESKAVYNTISPVWDDAFRFFLQDPANEEVDIQVKDDSRQAGLGSVTVRLARLLSADELTLDQWFQLENSGPSSRIYMKLVMRVLYLDAPEVCHTAQPCAPGQLDLSETTAYVGSSVDLPSRPTKSSPDAQFGMESVIRIHLLEAESLIAKDNFMGGMIKGKSDPYAKVRLGGQRFRSRVIKEDLNPRWNEIYEVIVNEIPGQEVEFELYDKDVDKDDFLGRCKVPLKRVLSSRFIDEWIPLEDVKSGRLHLKLECLPPTPSAAELEQVLMVNSLVQTARSEELSSTLLSVFVDRASDLPLRKGSKPPSPYVSLSVRDISYKSKVSSQTADPVWDEAFSFLIKRPHVESLELQVKDDGNVLGSLSVPLSQLLETEGLALDHWFQLSRSGPSSQILMRVQLGVLVSQHSGVEALSTPAAGEDEESLPRGSESELYIAEDGEAGSTQELRQRLPQTDSSSELSDSPLGQLRLTVWYHTDERKLIAEWGKDSKEIPDPYVSLILLPDKSRATKRKTSVRKRTLNPEFNERLEWELPLEDVQHRKLEAYIKNSVSFMSREKEPIGKVHLDLSQMDLTQGAPQWYDLKDDKSSS